MLFVRISLTRAGTFFAKMTEPFYHIETAALPGMSKQECLATFRPGKTYPRLENSPKPAILRGRDRAGRGQRPRPRTRLRGGQQHAAEVTQLFLDVGVRRDRALDFRAQAFAVVGPQAREVIAQTFLGRAQPGGDGGTVGHGRAAGQKRLEFGEEALTPPTVGKRGPQRGQGTFPRPRRPTPVRRHSPR